MILYRIKSISFEYGTQRFNEEDGQQIWKTVEVWRIGYWALAEKYALSTYWFESGVCVDESYAWSARWNESRTNQEAIQIGECGYICRDYILTSMSDSYICRNVVSTKNKLWDYLEENYMADNASSMKLLVGISSTIKWLTTGSWWNSIMNC